MYETSDSFNGSFVYEISDSLVRRGHVKGIFGNSYFRRGVLLYELKVK